MMDHSQSIDTTKPKLNFRGERKYLHSTSLFSAFTCFCQEESGMIPTEIDFTFPKITDQQIEIVEDHQGIEFVASFKHKEGQLFAVERKDKIVSAENYDEVKIGAVCLRSGNEIIVDRLPENFEFIDCLVFAFKTLSKEHAINGKVAFARLRLNQIPQSSFSVSYSRIVNKRFHEGDIKSPDGSLGKIYFGEWAV